MRPRGSALDTTKAVLRLSLLPAGSSCGVFSRVRCNELASSGYARQL